MCDSAIHGTVLLSTHGLRLAADATSVADMHHSSLQLQSTLPKIHPVHDQRQVLLMKFERDRVECYVESR